jgi:hypothetical protein
MPFPVLQEQKSLVESLIDREKTRVLGSVVAGKAELPAAVGFHLDKSKS